MSTLTEQKEALKARGYKVILNPILLEREAKLGEDDDWLFADMPGAVLILIGRDGFTLEVEKEGDADVEFEQVDEYQRLDPDGLTYRFRNEWVPDAFRRIIRDGEIVLIGDSHYQCTVRYNGWFTPFMTHKDDKVVTDHGAPDYEIGDLSGWADILEDYIKERKAETA